MVSLTTKISNNLLLKDCIKSQVAHRHGIANIPPPSVVKAMVLTAENCYDPVREFFTKSKKTTNIGISSFYRCEELNKLIGGAKNSQHITGEAIDIDADIYGGVTNKEIFEWIRNNLDFDQLIWEYGDYKQPAWVHVSYRKGGNRRVVFQCLKIKGKTVYKTL